MNYEESIRYIKDCTKYGIKLGLERITEILQRLGNPQQKFRSIHIAGTNGKGSTVAMMDAVLRQAGYRTGCYVSPHLVSYRERFTVNQQMITETELAEIVTEMVPVLQSIEQGGFGNPTEFEVGTVIAFEFFARCHVEVAVIEVGMGGRFDATNVLLPILSIITHIALDHQEFLGDTLEKIAFEKAGIIKPDIPVVIGLQEPAIERFLAGIALERHAPLRKASAIAYREFKMTEDFTEFQADDSEWGNLFVKLKLLGEHQVVNCLNVVAGMSFLRQAGFLISKDVLLNGLAQTVWPGRMERVRIQSPLKLYLDGAHNPDGAGALVKSIQGMYPGQKVHLLFGKLNNRPSEVIAGILAAITDQVIVTAVPDPKTTPLEKLAESFRKLGIPAVIEPEPEKALHLLLHSDHPVAVATGSLYLVGYLRGLLYPIGETI
jgi:dihydrofolate synthase / folylpolyglutamate synthase